jgi:hypothetical protein
LIVNWSEDNWSQVQGDILPVFTSDGGMPRLWPSLPGKYFRSSFVYKQSDHQKKKKKTLTCWKSQGWTKIWIQ